MKETIFEQVASAASVLKLDLSAEEFALFAEDREFSEAGMEAVQMLLGYLSEKKQQTTIQTLLKMSRLPTKAPKTFENFDFSLLKVHSAAPSGSWCGGQRQLSAANGSPV